VNLTGAINTPTDSPLLLKNACVDIIPGAAVFALSALFSYTPAAPPNLPVMRFAATGGAILGTAVAQRTGFHWAGSILVPPRSILNVFVIFSAAAAGNLINFDALGTIFPLGTLKLP